MQGKYKFMDLNTKQVIKHHKFTKFPMPDSVKLKIKCWGCDDRQTGRLRFCDHHNEPFEWTDEHESLIEDNAADPEPVPFPVIHVEMPGVAMESHDVDLPTPAAEEIPEPTIEDHALAAAANANFGPRQAEFNELETLTGMTHDQNDSSRSTSMSSLPSLMTSQKQQITKMSTAVMTMMMPHFPHGGNSASSDDGSTYAHNAVDGSDMFSCMTSMRITTRTTIMRTIRKGVKGTTGHFQECVEVAGSERNLPTSKTSCIFQPLQRM